MKFLRTPILKNFCIRLLLNWLYEVIVWNFISGVHLKSSSVILQRCQWLSNQSFKQNLWHVLSIHLTPMLSCEPRFPMFINRHYTKVLGLFGKRCNNVLCVIWLDRNYCRWNLQRQHLNQYIKFIYIENVVVLHREWLVLFVLLLWHFQKLNLTGGFLIFLFMLTGIEIFVCSAGCTSLIVWCWIIKLGGILFTLDTHSLSFVNHLADYQKTSKVQKTYGRSLSITSENQLKKAALVSLQVWFWCVDNKAL